MAAKRKIIVECATSADGFIARKDGGLDWLIERPHPKDNYGMGAFYRSIDTILLGRKTFDVALEFERQGMRPFDPKLKYFVFSRSIPGTPLPKAVEHVAEPIKQFATKLRAKRGKHIWMMGGSEIIAAFLDEGEIDELSIHVMPVFIGEGIPLIAPRHRSVELKLLATKSFPDGVVGLHYAVQEAAKKARAPQR
jgi:dihydrofolate reductase